MKKSYNERDDGLKQEMGLGGKTCLGYKDIAPSASLTIDDHHDPPSTIPAASQPSPSSPAEPAPPAHLDSRNLVSARIRSLPFYFTHSAK